MEKTPKYCHLLRICCQVWDQKWTNRPITVRTKLSGWNKVDFWMKLHLEYVNKWIKTAGEGWKRKWGWKCPFFSKQRIRDCLFEARQVICCVSEQSTFKSNNVTTGRKMWCPFFFFNLLRITKNLIQSGSCAFTLVPVRDQLKRLSHLNWVASPYTLLKYIPRIKRHET